MIVGMQRDEKIVERLTAEVKRSELEAQGYADAGDEELAEGARKDVRAAQAKLDSYVVDTRSLTEDYVLHSAEIDLDNKRNAKAIEAGVQKRRAERDELLRSYPTLRGSFTKDKSIGEDPPEFPEDEA